MQKLPTALEKVCETHHKNTELKAAIAEIEQQLEQNYQQMIRDFFPYLLSVYQDWRPQFGEVAMAIRLNEMYCFEVTICSIDRFGIRAQEGTKPVYHSFDLNPKIEEYELPHFIIPKHAYEKDIKQLFQWQFLHQ